MKYGFTPFRRRFRKSIIPLNGAKYLRSWRDNYKLPADWFVWPDKSQLSFNYRKAVDVNSLSWYREKLEGPKGK